MLYMYPVYLMIILLTLFRMREGGGLLGDKRPPPTSFPPVASTNVGISPKSFQTFSFSLFSTLV